MFHRLRRLVGLFRRKNKQTQSVPVPDVTPPGSETRGETEVAVSSESVPSKSVPSASASSESVPSESVPSPKKTKSIVSTQPSTQKSSIENLKPVLSVLRAYVMTFGRPAAEIELRAVVGAIVANLATVTIENSQLEGFIDEVLAAFDALGAEVSFADVTAQLLAEQTSIWLRQQEVTVSNVISAYLQQFAPNDAVWNSGALIGLVQTVIATLNDGSLSRSGGRVLVMRVMDAFDLDRSLSRWVAPEWVALAQQVASYLSYGELQLEVRSIAWSYIRQFQAILSPQLIEQIAESGPLTISPAELLSEDLGNFAQMLYYKFQLLEADPVVMKSHQEIAANLHRAIADFQAQRAPVLDVTRGIQTGDLEVSSPFRRSEGD